MKPFEADPLETQRALRVALHDLKQPLASAFLILGTWRNQAVACACEEVSTANDLEAALTALHDRIHELSRIVDKQPDPAASFDAVEAVDDVAKQARPLLSRAGVALVVQCDPGPILVRGPRTLFDRLLLNLLENAARHARNAQQVAVTLSGDRHAVRLSVEDDGVGWGSDGPYRPGGLGLASCVSAVRSLGGSFYVGEGHGGGHFEAKLPLADAAVGPHRLSA